MLKATGAGSSSRRSWNRRWNATNGRGEAETASPRLEIDLGKLADNARTLLALYGSRGIRLTAVTKGVCGSPPIAHALRGAGVSSFGDSRLSNIQRMRASGLDGEFMLLRIPMPSEVERVVEVADTSLNSEVSVIRLLARAAERRGKVHRVLLMVELGDLREGILPRDLESTVAAVRNMPGVALAGIGANLACFAGVCPTERNMGELSEIARRLQRSTGTRLEFVSGGNSANYRWFRSTADIGLINHLRIGESLLLGCETLTRAPIPGLHTDAFTLVAEVIERKTKPSKPWGTVAQDAFGEVRRFEDHGLIDRAILALGRQDVDVSMVRPRTSAAVLGACSDEMVLDVTACDVGVGEELRFDLGYGALLRAMTSPYVEKVFLQRPEVA